MRVRSEKEEYVANPTMWTEKGDRLTTVGDYLGRLPSIQLLNPKVGEVILDAGCGAGFCSRRIARSGAKVYGCDRAEKMIAQAIKHEQENTLGIEYCLADITRLPYKDEMFDAVFCVAVLIHDSPKECKRFFAEAFRVLKPGGRIMTSIMHEALYKKGSPNRTGHASWAQYRPLENKILAWIKDKNIFPMKSRRFEEIYRDSLGNIFTSTVWCHPKGLFPEMLSKIGFCVTREQEMYVTAEVLEACNQAGEIGYLAFNQVLAKKGEIA